MRKKLTVEALHICPTVPKTCICCIGFGPFCSLTNPIWMLLNRQQASASHQLTPLTSIGSIFSNYNIINLSLFVCRTYILLRFFSTDIGKFVREIEEEITTNQKFKSTCVRKVLKIENMGFHEEEEEILRKCFQKCIDLTAKKSLEAGMESENALFMKSNAFFMKSNDLRMLSLWTAIISLEMW